MNATCLTTNEERVFAYISTAPKPVTLTEIATTVFPDLESVKANSWVRNSLRRLRDKMHVVRKVNRGTYALEAPEAVVAPPVAVVAAPRPIQLSIAQVASISMDDVQAVKNLHCAYYNDCLTVARDGNWKGFGCQECTAFIEMPPDQRMSDMVTLIALDAASENAEELGCAGRKRGVRPGADAKVKPRKLYVVQGDDVPPLLKKVSA